MGHRDIWGKEPSKWKKQCPCFDAEAEYANIDTLIKQSKWEDKVPNSPIKQESYIDKIKKLAQWN